MNKAFILIGIPAALAVCGYVLLAIFVGVHLTYYRILGGAVTFFAALYFVRKSQQKKSRSKIG